MRGHEITPDRPVIVIGAGPAGLTAAYELARRKVPVTVLEQDRQGGGIARTATYKGFRFDIGGHRFFTKVAVVSRLWRQLLGDDLLRRPRLSRIIYRNRFFDYPLKPLNALFNLGLWTTLAILLSYFRAKLFPIRTEVSFADWVTNRFGKRLFEIFFKTYTEKVWGIPCHTIGVQWAVQRIKGLSLRTALVTALAPRMFRSSDEIKTLISEFWYPRLGPGMMWEALRDRTVALGGKVILGCRVTRIEHDGSRVLRVEVDQDGTPLGYPADEVISSMPIKVLILALSPPAPEEVRAAAEHLTYRDFLTVALIVEGEDLFPDNWLYIHDETVRVGRIQNFGNWSPEMVPEPGKSCLGLEYFCAEGDDLWTMADAELVALAARELAAIGLVPGLTVLDGAVVRMPKAYPVYDEVYPSAIKLVREYLARFPNLQAVGRNGMHRYNNMDHSMLTGMLAVRNLFHERLDLWAINVDDAYYEEGEMVEIEGRGDFLSGGDPAAMAHHREQQRRMGRSPLTIQAGERDTNGMVK
jgi:protoporphyrinogen oxidase